MVENIKLGYEVKKGTVVEISPEHLGITGLTHQSGKTTALLGILKRSKKTSIIFSTKVGEKAITEGTKIPPFFREKTEWRAVYDLLQAITGEQLKLHRSSIIEICEGRSNWLEIKKALDECLVEDKDVKGRKLNSFTRSIYTELQAFLEEVIPEIKYSGLSKTLNLSKGINIIDMRDLSKNMQSLVIKSVLEEVLEKYTSINCVVPELWKFAPQRYGNPAKRSIEEFVRQGATNGNYLYLDSQDITNVDKAPVKSISTWLIGFQNEPNEVKKVIDHIPLPKSSKPKPNEIQNLGLGEFYLCERGRVVKIYIQPAWIKDSDAKAIAFGKKKASDFSEDIPIEIKTKEREEEEKSKPSEEVNHNLDNVKKEINELRIDFYNKLQEDVSQMQEESQKTRNYVNRIASDVLELKNKEINVDDIIPKVLQKIPITHNPIIDKEEIIKEVLSKVPSGGMKVYKVAPLEKLKKDFLEEAKNKILEDVRKLSEDAKRMLKYLESKSVRVTSNELVYKCFLYNSTGGLQQKKVKNAFEELKGYSLAIKDSHGKFGAELKARIKFYLENHEATEQEINQVYDYILAELL